MRKLIAIVLAVLQFAFCAFVAGKNVLDEKERKQRLADAYAYGEKVLLRPDGFQITETKDGDWRFSFLSVSGYERYYGLDDLIRLSADEEGYYVISPYADEALTVRGGAYDDACIATYTLDRAAAAALFGEDRAAYGVASDQDWEFWYGDFGWGIEISGNASDVAIGAIIYENELYLTGLVVNGQQIPIIESVD